MVSNFVMIGQTIATCGDISIFQNGGRRHLGFLTFENYGVFEL